MSKRYVGGIVSVGLDGINSPVTEVEYLVVQVAPLMVLME